MNGFKDLTKEELKVFKQLNSPHKLQDFINAIPANFEKNGETLRSPRWVLKERQAHCAEGAFLAAAVLWFHGQKPLLMDLKTTDDDFDHVVALFCRGKFWGAISKTNHAVLRYREPIYANPRELAMSYFHEYFLDNGAKTLRSYSAPFDLSKIRLNSLDNLGVSWLTTEEDLWQIADLLDSSPHYRILDKKKVASLRRADPIEIKAGKLTEESVEGCEGPVS